jgi:hypothetical protein
VEHVAFSFGVKRARNSYSIEPTSGFLCPQSTFTVFVTLEKVREYMQCNDEFLVQTIVVRGNRFTSKHIMDNIFNMSSNVVHKEKLTVVYLPPDRAPNLLYVGKASDPQRLESFSVSSIQQKFQSIPIRVLNGGAGQLITRLVICSSFPAYGKLAVPSYFDPHSV